jgi:hypothetical protein
LRGYRTVNVEKSGLFNRVDDFLSVVEGWPPEDLEA